MNSIHLQYREIVDLLGVYFDGWYEGDPGKLRHVFHPSCHLYCAIEGTLDDDGMDKVYGYVANRPSPASKNAARHDAILSINVTGPDVAAATVRLAINGKLFTDHLSLLRLDGRWQIVSKTFGYVPLGQA